MPAPKKTNNPLDPKRVAQKPSGSLTAPKQNAYQKSMTAGMGYASAKNMVKQLEKLLAEAKKYKRDPEGVRPRTAEALTNARVDASKSKRNYENLSSKSSKSKYAR
jgi:hypothetical protein